jgi:hypothetical protein
MTAMRALVFLMLFANPGRVDIEVRECLPVGYGLACRCDVQGAGPATLEACIGNSSAPAGFYERVAHAPIIGHPGPPLTMWIDVKPAAPTDRYCGILIQGATHSRVVAFGP